MSVSKSKSLRVDELSEELNNFNENDLLSPGAPNLDSRLEEIVVSSRLPELQKDDPLRNFLENSTNIIPATAKGSQAHKTLMSRSKT